LSDQEDEAISEDDEDVAISEDDEERLAKMTELEREMELAERAERQQQKRQRAELLKAAKKQGPRRSGREVREEHKKKSAIEELKAARERKARGERSRIHDFDDDDVSEKSHGRKKRDTYDDEMMSEEEEEEEEDGYTSGDGYNNDDDDEEASYQEVKSIQVRRYKLEEWFDKPFFEKTLPGCMVRLAAGNKKSPTGETMYDDRYRPVVQYMAAKVVGLVEKEPGYYKYLNQSAAPWKSPYPFGPKGEKTSLWLRVMRGNSEKIWPLAQVSNSSITEQEFFRYHQQCEQNKTSQVTRGQVERVRTRLVAAENYVYSETDVSKLLEKKRSKRNVAMEKATLERERDAAMQRGEQELVADLDAQIRELQWNMNKKRKKKDTLAELNKKNASINFKTTMMAEQQEDASGADTLDPFRRRATRPIVYWNTSNKNAEEGALEDGIGYMIDSVEEHGNGKKDLLQTCVALLADRHTRRSNSVHLSRLFNPNSDRRRKLASRKFLGDGLSYYSIDEFERHGRQAYI